MNEVYQKLIEAKDGIVLKTERVDTRNRLGHSGWVGQQTNFLLDGIAYEYRTGFVYPTRWKSVPYNKVVSYCLPEYFSVEATEFFSGLI